MKCKPCNAKAPKISFYVIKDVTNVKKCGKKEEVEQIKTNTRKKLDCIDRFLTFSLPFPRKNNYKFSIQSVS